MKELDIRCKDSKRAQNNLRPPHAFVPAVLVLRLVSLPVFDLAFLSAVAQAQPARAHLQLHPALTAAGSMAVVAHAHLARQPHVERIAARGVRVGMGHDVELGVERPQVHHQGEDLARRLVPAQVDDHLTVVDLPALYAGRAHERVGWRQQYEIETG